MKNPVFLLGSHKSGTSLLRSLLDGAPELFVVPLEAHFFQYGGYWVDYALRQSLPNKLTLQQLIDVFTRHVQKSNEIATFTSDSDLTGAWDVDRFTAHLQSITQGQMNTDYSFRVFLDRYIEAIYLGLHGDYPATQRFVEKSVENAEYAVVLKYLYPGARFVHLVRNPYATLTSLRKHMTRQHYPFLGKAVSSLYNSYYYLYKNTGSISEYLIVQYEDLITNPQRVMRNVAEFIGIEFAENLLSPTSLGVSWQGNSTSGEKYVGISQNPNTAWRSEIEPIEMALINRLLRHVLRDYKYEQLEIKSVYRPAHREKLRTYIKNRLFWLLVRRSRITLV